MIKMKKQSHLMIFHFIAISAFFFNTSIAYSEGIAFVSGCGNSVSQSFCDSIISRLEIVLSEQNRFSIIPKRDVDAEFSARDCKMDFHSLPDSVVAAISKELGIKYWLYFSLVKDKEYVASIELYDIDSNKIFFLTEEKYNSFESGLYLWIQGFVFETLNNEIYIPALAEKKLHGMEARMRFEYEDMEKKRRPALFILRVTAIASAVGILALFIGIFA